jgi:cell division septation protein DedD
MVDLGAGRSKEELRDLVGGEDAEITLSTGKLVGIFSGLVLVCSFFFTIGYMLGRSNASGGKTEIVGAAPTGGNPTGKPVAGDKTPAQTPTPGTDQSAPQPQATISLSPPANPSSNSLSSTPLPEIKASTTGAYTVQVAAVSHLEDAQSLVAALQRKQYPVFLANIPGDSLFHVQVGPFNDLKDAETMRSRLAAEGYDAIVKK